MKHILGFFLFLLIPSFCGAAISASHVKYFGYYDNGLGDPLPLEETIRDHRNHTNVTLHTPIWCNPATHSCQDFGSMARIQAAGLKMVVALAATPDDPVMFQSYIDLIRPYIPNIAAVGIIDEYDCGAPFPTGWTPENCRAARLYIESLIAAFKAHYPNTPTWVNYTSAYMWGVAQPNGAARGYQVPTNADWISMDCYTPYEACFGRQATVDYLLDGLERTLAPNQRVVLIPQAFQGNFAGYQLTQNEVAAIAEQYYARSQRDSRVVAIIPFIWRDVIDYPGNTLVGARDNPIIRAKYLDIGKRIVGNRGTPGDYTGDWNADAAIWRPSDGGWHISGLAGIPWGNSLDIPTPGDYNGDGITDRTVYRPSNGTWYVYGVGEFQFGTSGDIPVPGDYDGDGRTDLAVFRPSNVTWYIFNSRTGTPTSLAYGLPSDIPVPGDYDGDGRTDIAIYRSSAGSWHLNGMGSFSYGTASSIPVPGDYDGDGRTDLAVYNPINANWSILASGTGVTRSVAYGIAGDIPVPADFNGDRQMDIAVWRRSDGRWYIQNQSGLGPWGGAGDIPVVHSVITIIHAMGLIQIDFPGTPPPPPPPPPSGGLSAPNLTLLEGRVFLLRDTLTISYSETATGFNWEFLPETSAVSGALAHSGAAPVRTTAPSFSLASLSLTPGLYTVRVQALNGAQQSAWSTARITLAASDFASVRIYPNPFNARRHTTPQMTFDGLPVNSSLKIFTVSGRWVKTLRSNSTSLVWDLTNDSGDKVASGIYLYVISSQSGDQKTGQITVVR